MADSVSINKNITNISDLINGLNNKIQASILEKNKHEELLTIYQAQLRYIKKDQEIVDILRYRDLRDEYIYTRQQIREIDKELEVLNNKLSKHYKQLDELKKQLLNDANRQKLQVVLRSNIIEFPKK